MTRSLALQVLYTSKTFELSIDHNSQSSAQCLTLLHTKQMEKTKSKFSSSLSPLAPRHYLCDVSMTLLPSLIIPVRTSHKNRLVAGSIPVVGSSSNRIGGLPTRDTAVLNFLLLPPLKDRQNQYNLVQLSIPQYTLSISQYTLSILYLYVPHLLFAYFTRSSRSISVCTQLLMAASGIPLSLANSVRSSLPVSLSMSASN